MNDLSLGEVARVARSGWRRITIASLVGAAICVVVALVSNKVYESEVVLFPKESSPSSGLTSQLGQLSGIAGLMGLNLDGSRVRDESLAVLRSRAFVADFIRRNSLVPQLTAARAMPFWPRARKTMDMVDAVEYFEAKVRIIYDDKKLGIVRITIRWPEPAAAASLANSMASQLNKEVREQAIQESTRNVEYLRTELEKSQLVALSQSISTLLEGEMKRLMIARGREDYAFRVLDPAQPAIRPVGPGRFSWGFWVCCWARCSGWCPCCGLPSCVSARRGTAPSSPLERSENRSVSRRTSAMRILYFHQYFNTPAMSGSTRSYEMARRLVAAGHQVEMITSWRDATDKRDWFVTHEEGIRVHWLPRSLLESPRVCAKNPRIPELCVGIGLAGGCAACGCRVGEQHTADHRTAPIYAKWRRGVPLVFEVGSGRGADRHGRFEITGDSLAGTPAREIRLRELRGDRGAVAGDEGRHARQGCVGRQGLGHSERVRSRSGRRGRRCARAHRELNWACAPTTPWWSIQAHSVR